MRELGWRFSARWCRTFHPKPFWPIHGHYQCPSCLRTYPVPWSEGGRLNPANTADAVESRTRGSGIGIAQLFAGPSKLH